MGIVFNGPSGVDLMRLTYLASGLRLEQRTGGKVRLSAKIPKSSAIAKQIYNLPARSKTDYDQLLALVNADIKATTDTNARGEFAQPIVEATNANTQ